MRLIFGDKDSIEYKRKFEQRCEEEAIKTKLDNYSISCSECGEDLVVVGYDIAKGEVYWGHPDPHECVEVTDFNGNKI